ncbi:NAD(+)--dinitrogen-reductase ADP-D-ribosyltransferase [Vibrio sp. JC009]|uniref:NAD(+)--dinitrogen-reductase ADP-D-ribosyltransferase n=1 Tax=Vibrio sp. JC009 TaxID=2912314 RepID=UPI0023B11D13|nr:NAD(+)--dinitrogen-reductase ADP-D-ribosyltransferase [Vibrio sp. JC009]WED24078.1 NAD(+)--dinitrogen-reductase ADP-D-ribosyltransferase [Vibrio sp. JC009]
MDKQFYSLSADESRLLQEITLPLNHCNVPSQVLASLAYQCQPIPLEIDSVNNWHPAFLHELKDIDNPISRARCFKEFMTARFCLSRQSGDYRNSDDPPPRPKVNYRRLLLGWLFDSDNEQGAAWRSWVESRFGLLTRFHAESLSGPDSPEYLRFREKCTRATYNTNELYDQLDLLYCFCQQELRLRHPGALHLTLYRGCTEMPGHIINEQPVKLFNNLSSFTSDEESALRFGSKVFAVQVPLTKIACFDSLLPGSLEGEQEYMVLGGLYLVKQVKI